MNFKTIILAGVLSSVALVALADETNNKDYYVQLNAGASFGQKPKGDFLKGNLGTSSLYGFAVGYKFHEHFRADLSLDYRPGYKNSYNENKKIEDINFDYTHNIKVKSLVSMVSFYYDIATINNFTPYITSGFGFARNKTNNYVMTANSSESDPANATVYSKGTKTDFAWKVGLGSKYAMNRNFDLDLRYQYADLGKFETGGTSSYNGEAHESAAPLKGKIKSHEVLLGVAYKF